MSKPDIRKRIIKVDLQESYLTCFECNDSMIYDANLSKRIYICPSCFRAEYPTEYNGIHRMRSEILRSKNKHKHNGYISEEVIVKNYFDTLDYVLSKIKLDKIKAILK